MGILTDRQIRNENIVTPCEPCVTRPGVVSYGLTSYGYDARIGYRFRVFKPYPATVIDPKAFDERMFEAVDLTQRGCVSCRGLRRTLVAGQPDTTICYACGGKLADYNVITIPPHSFALGETVERFRIPRDTLAVVVGKSTYARCGLIVNVTPLEPEWEGVVTVELSNTTPLPLRVYAGEGIMQVLFLRSDGHRAMDRKDFEDVAGAVGQHHRALVVPHTRSCETSYADKKGRYQGQTGITSPTVDRVVDCNTDAEPAQVASRIVCPHCIAGRLNRMPNADCPHCAGLGFTYEGA